MGVPRLFSTLRATFPQAFSRARPSLSHVYIDANAMLYPIAEVTKVPTSIGETILKTAQQYGNTFTSSVSLHFDGAPPMGKIRQQRMRRFQYDPVTVITTTSAEVGDRKGVVDIIPTETNLQLWSPAMFSPATDMMRKIHEYIEDNIGSYNRVSAYSSYLDSGEGEHKIIRDIRQRRTDRVAIVSKDADILLLSMILVEELDINIFVLRHDDAQMMNGFRPEDPLYYVDTRQLRNLIMQRMQISSIWDFVLATFYVGNDFLPPVPGVDDMGKVFPIVSRIFQETDIQLYEQGQISWRGMLQFISSLMERVQPNTEWIQLLPESEKRASTRNVVSHDIFDTLYYPNMSPFPVNVSKLSEAWMITIEWVFSYYHDGMDSISQAWQYVPYFSPTLDSLQREISLAINAISPLRQVATESLPPPTPLQTLGAVLPIWLWDLIPDADIKKRLRQVRQYYPYAFERIHPTGDPIIPSIPYSVVSSL